MIKCGHCKGVHKRSAQVYLCSRIEAERKFREAQEEAEALADYEAERYAESAWLRAAEAPTWESIRDLDEHDRFMADCS